MVVVCMSFYLSVCPSVWTDRRTDRRIEGQTKRQAENWQEGSPRHG